MYVKTSVTEFNVKTELVRHSLLDKTEISRVTIDASKEISCLRCHKDNFNYVVIGYTNGEIEIRKTEKLDTVAFSTKFSDQTVA